MQSVRLRFLVLVFGAMLILPPRWCCILPGLFAAHATAESASPCCCCRVPDSKTHDQPKSPPSPDPVKCPCEDRLTTTFDVFKPAAPEQGCILPPLAATPVTMSHTSFEPATTPTAQGPLYALHCILLC